MRYKQFGNTGMKVSELCIGTWAIGGANWGEVNHADSLKAIRTMLDNGVNFIDTAPAYNGGAAERAVGEAVKGRRDQVYIATKIGVRYIDGHYVNSNAREMVYQQCEQSLKDLGTDYIDLYLIHWPDPNVPVGETLEAINDLIRQGKVLHVGLSNFSPELIAEAEKYAKIEALQAFYCMVNRESEPWMTFAEGKGIGTMTYGSLGGGILTGAFREIPTFAPGDTRNSFYPYFKEPNFSKCMNVLAAMDKVSQAHGGVPLAQIALNWNTRKSFVSTSIVGVRNEKEALENCAAMQWNLTEEDMALLDEAIEVNCGMGLKRPPRPARPTEEKK